MSRYLFAATLAMLAAMTASSGISRLPYRLHPSSVPGGARLYAIGTRSMAQRSGAFRRDQSDIFDYYALINNVLCVRCAANI